MYAPGLNELDVEYVFPLNASIFAEVDVDAKFAETVESSLPNSIPYELNSLLVKAVVYQIGDFGICLTLISVDSKIVCDLPTDSLYQAVPSYVEGT
tara:strand:+ start:595 stop:882 length:288 start_codon:yes stop_codon:yes gene_type:complete